MIQRPTRRRVIQAAAVTGGLAGVGLTSACASEDEGGASGPMLTVAASEVPVGSGLVLDNTYAVVQPTEGEFRAFTAICPHQGCAVREITETEIICPCHSSRFSTTDGTAMSGPTDAPLAPAQVTEADGQLTIGPA